MWCVVIACGNSFLVKRRIFAKEGWHYDTWLVTSDCVGGVGRSGDSLRVEVLPVPLSSLSLAGSSVVMVLVVTSLMISSDIEEMEAKSCTMGSG